MAETPKTPNNFGQDHMKTSEAIKQQLKNLLRMEDLPFCLWIFQEGICIQSSPMSGIEFHTSNDSLFFKINPLQLTLPFFLVHYTSKNETSALGTAPDEIETQHRTVLTVEKGAATFIELHLDADNFTSKTRASTEISLNENATLTHVQIQHGNHHSSQALNTEIKQSADSHYQGFLFAFNLLQHQACVWLGLHHNHAQADLKGVMFLKGRENSSLNITVLHQEPHCESNVLVRGLVDEAAKGEFSGKIIIEENGSQSQAKLENKNLLISQHAEMITRPELEVFNDDVQCSHGATVGHLDLQALFYLTSRGIPLDIAKKMLMESFVRPAFTGLPQVLIPYIEACLYER